jgi:hypothetical protein
MQIPANRLLRGLCPSLRAAGNALVGLLAPEFGPTRPSHHGNAAAMAKIESGRPNAVRTRSVRTTRSLGYSGGAAPDLHRCSLFVGPSHGKKPTTNARRNGFYSSEVKEAVNRSKEETPTQPSNEKKPRGCNPWACCGLQQCGRTIRQSKNPTNSWLRDGCWSLRTALASICRIRSRVTLKMWPTSSNV